jgi:hypothetical protein
MPMATNLRIRSSKTELRGTGYEVRVAGDAGESENPNPQRATRNATHATREKVELCQA